MKKLILISIFAFTSVKIYAFEFNFHLDISKWQGQKGLQKIEVPNLALSKESGRPMLPYEGQIIIGDIKDLSFEVDWGKSVELKLQPEWAKDQKCRCKEIQDQSLANMKKFYHRPLQSIQTTSLGDYKGVKLTLVKVYPWGWDGKKLKAFPQMKVTVYNKQQLAKSFSGQSLKEQNSKSMLILGPKDLVAGLDEFIAWKKSLGLEVQTVFMEELENNPNALKKFFYERYHSDTGAFDYALIVGNEKVVTPFFLVTKFDRQTPSDWPYFLMGDENDIIADVAYSRLSFKSVLEIKNWAQKLMASQKNGPQVLNTMAIASNEGMEPSDVDYVKEMAKPLQEHLGAQTQFFFQGTESSSAQKIASRLESEVQFINYIGHGSGFSWPSVTGREFSINDLKEVNWRGSDSGPVVIDVACQNGRFSGEGRFGETFMASKDQQFPIALAYYGGSVDISWDPPAVMAIGVSKALGDGITDLGQALFDGQMFLMKNHSSLDEVKDNFVWYHLQGDPSMQVNFRH